MWFNKIFEDQSLLILQQKTSQFSSTMDKALMSVGLQSFQISIWANVELQSKFNIYQRPGQKQLISWKINKFRTPVFLTFIDVFIFLLTLFSRIVPNLLLAWHYVNLKNIKFSLLLANYLRIWNPGLENFLTQLTLLWFWLKLKLSLLSWLFITPRRRLLTAELGQTGKATGCFSRWLEPKSARSQRLKFSLTFPV